MAVFICYRRDDTEGEARALYTRLAKETDESNLFLDHDAIGAGDDWRERIDATLKKVEAVLVVIGPRWFQILDQRAKAKSNDTVVQEIAVSLAHPKVRVIPVLVNGATLPPAATLPAEIQKLADRNAIEVRGSAWKDDTARLVKALRKAGALPAPRSRWFLRAAAAVALLAIAGAAYGMRVVVPAVPPSMSQSYARELIESRWLTFKENRVKTARFQGYIVEGAQRGIPVAADQRPPAGQTIFRGQTVEVDFIVREPYRLVCKGGGELTSPGRADVVKFDPYPAAWSLDMPPGSCAWVTSPLVPNQDPYLKPLGFKDKLPELFKNAPGGFLVFCSYSEYDQPNASKSERLVAINYNQFLSPDDNGKLNPTVSGHVCDERF